MTPPGSRWLEATAPPFGPLPPLRGEVVADVAVVGGGYTGLSAALHLAERGLRTVLLEAARIGAGASGRNGGQVGSHQRLDQDELERRFGHGRARALFDLALEAKATVKERIARHAIACDLRPGVIEAAHRPRHAAYYPAYAERLARDYGYPHLRALDRDETTAAIGSCTYHGGLLDADAAHLHPLAYARGLARAATGAGAILYENSRVLRREAGRGHRLLTASGSVRAAFVVLACNAHLEGLEPLIAPWILPITACQVVTAPLPLPLRASILACGAAVYDTRTVVDYFRPTADGRIVFGGGEAWRRGGPRDLRAFVRPHLLRVFPQLRGLALEDGWAGRIALTTTRLPHLSRPAPGVLAAQGYSGHGVAQATLAGKLIAEVIAGTAERFDLMAAVAPPPFPLGTLLRWPALVLGGLYMRLRDRL